MSSRKTNAEPELVVRDKSLVAKKALSELIATKWRATVQVTGRDQVLDMMAEAIAKKGRMTPAPVRIIRRSQPTVVQRPKVSVKRSVIKPEEDPRTTVQRGEPRVIEQSQYERVVRGEPMPNARKSLGRNQDQDVIMFDLDEPVVRTQMKPKTYDIIIEKPVIREIIVEKPYEVLVEKPVENIIEKEIVVEKVVEIPIQKIIEREVQEVEEIEKEVIKEMPVYTERIVENHIEQVVERQVERIVNVDVEVEEIVDVTTERLVARPFREEIQMKETIIDVPQVVEEVRAKTVQRVVDKYVDVEVIEYVDRITEQEVDKYIYVDKVIDIPVEQVVIVEELVEEEVRQVVNKTRDVEKPVYYDVIKKIQKPIKKSIIREVEKEILVERVEEVEKREYRDVVTEVEVVREVPREQIVEVQKVVEVIENVEVPETIIREVIKEVEVETPIYRKVAKYVEVPIEKYVDKIVERPIDVYVEEEIRKTVRVDQVVEREVEKIVYVEVPVEKVVERIIEVEIIKDVPVYVDKIVEKQVEVIVEKHVQVLVPKFVEVPVERVVDKVIETEVIVENPVYVEQDDVEEEVRMATISGQSQILRKSYNANVGKLKTLEQEKNDLQWKLRDVQNIRKSNTGNRRVAQTTIGREENLELRNELNTLHNELSDLLEVKQREQIRSEVEGQVRKSSKSRRMERYEVEDEEGLKRNPNLRVKSGLPSDYNNGTTRTNTVYTDIRSSPATYSQPRFTQVNAHAPPPGQVRYVTTSSRPATNVRTYTNSEQGPRIYSKTKYAQNPVAVKRSSNVVNSGIRYGESRKSQTRYFTIDENGNRLYADATEHRRLEGVERNSGIHRPSGTYLPSPSLQAPKEVTVEIVETVEVVETVETQPVTVNAAPVPIEVIKREAAQEESVDEVMVNEESVKDEQVHEIPVQADPESTHSVEEMPVKAEPVNKEEAENKEESVKEEGDKIEELKEESKKESNREVPVQDEAVKAPAVKTE